MKDKRYETVKILIDTGNLKRLSDIIDNIPPGILAKDLSTNYNRLIKVIENPSELRLRELVKLANLLGIDKTKFADIVISQLEKDADENQEKILDNGTIKK